MAKHMRRFAVVGIALGAMAWGCGSESPARCRQLCKVEAECTTEAGDDTIQFSRGECERTCAILERSSEGKEIVESHANCVEKANDDCSKILQCE